MPPSDSVPRIGAPSATDGSAPVAARAAGQATGASATAAAAADTAGGASAGGSAPVHPNPAAILDPASGLVVMEFRDAQDQVVRTVPSRQQIDAYEVTQHGQPSRRQADASDAATAKPSFHGTATLPADPVDTAATAANPVSDGASLVATAATAQADTAPAGSVVQTSSTTGT
jgi:hypothetical protein